MPPPESGKEYDAGPTDAARATGHDAGREQRVQRTGATLNRVSRGRRGAAGSLRSRWTTVAGCRIHARASTESTLGEPAIVLVHGLAVSGRYLLPTARRLAGRYPVLVPDLPGHGKSDTPPVTPDVPGLADGLLAWLDDQGVDRAVFVANSLGCQTVVELAVRHPDRVLGLVLTGPTGDPAARSVLRWLGRLLLDVPREPLGLVLLEAVEYLRAGPLRVFRMAKAMVADPFSAKLPLVTQPTLVVRGSRDPIAPQPWVEEITRRLPDGRSAVIPAAAHAINYSAPDALAALVSAFVGERRTPAAESAIVHAVP